MSETGSAKPSEIATTSLDGQVLIAMPGMSDPRFERSVIFMCAHSEQGAMGLIINKPVANITFAELLKQLDISDAASGEAAPDLPICVGGPVESGRGFVLHSADYVAKDSTLVIDERTCMTATLDILKAIAGGRGPERALLALGYAGWAPGQLEDEIQRNGWLTCAADASLVFGTEPALKYDQALARMGISEAFLSSEVGHA